MQLILDSDLDLNIQTKMSTIQQESLNEKFINTSLDHTICSNSTNIISESSKCAEGQDIVKEYEEDITMADQDGRQIEMSQTHFKNETSSDECEKLKVLDMKSSKNVEDGESKNVLNKQLQENYSNEVEITNNKQIEEITETTVVNNDYENNSETKNNIKHNCELGKDEINQIVHKNEKEEQVCQISDDKQIEAQDGVKTHALNDTINDLVTPDVIDVLAQSEVITQPEVKIKNIDQKNIEINVAFDEYDRNKVNVTSDKTEELITPDIGNTLEQMEVINETEDKIEKFHQENIVMEDTDTSEEQDKNKVSIINDEIKELVTSDPETVLKDVEVINETEEKMDKINHDNNEMDVTFEEEDTKMVNTIKDKIEENTEIEEENKRSAECMDVDVIIEEQNDVVMSVVASQCEEQVKVTHEMEEKEQNQNDDNVEKANNTAEHYKDTVILAENKVKEYENIHSENRVTLENTNEIISQKEDEEIDCINISFEEQEKGSNNIIDDVIKEDNKVNSEIDDTLQKQSEVACVLIENKFNEDTIVINAKNNTVSNKLEVVTENVNYIEHENVIKSNLVKTVEQGIDCLDFKEVEVAIRVEAEEQIKCEPDIPEDKIEEPRQQATEKFILEPVKNIHDESGDISNSIIENKCEVVNNIKDITKRDIIENDTRIKEEDKSISSVVKKYENEDMMDKETEDTIVNEQYRSDTDNNKQQKNTTHIDNKETTKECTEIFQKDKEYKYEVDIISEDAENETSVDHKNNIANIEQNAEKQNSNAESNSNIMKDTSADIKMETDEIIDIADEKDEDDEKNKEKKDSSIGTSISALENGIQAVNSKEELKEVVSRDKSPSEAIVEHVNLKNPIADVIEEKKKLTHISKLSNTLDILSDEEEDLPKDTPSSDDKECTSINIDDDDDIMLIDEDSNIKDDQNKNSPLQENEITLESYSTTDFKEKEELISENAQSVKDTIQADEAIPNSTEMKTSEHKQESIVKEEIPKPNEPLMKPNFLKTFKKKLADMTRDEVEEFCILKIVESVVDRSNFNEIKSHLRMLTEKIEEYKKKAAILSKQNRDLQVVIKSVQEEQKKASNKQITPLKITRSVGMQVIMTDNGALRKKMQAINTAKNNAASNNGSIRQGKPAQNSTRLQKMLTNICNTPPTIPVPRLIPALNNTNVNNMKIQPPPANTPAKSQSTGSVNNSPNQSQANGLPSVPSTPVAQKPEKRSHARMQQNNSVTVDLTDDEPPAKLISRVATPPVRVVPPQNLLAPHRQPFGQNVSSPRKVYIPISGSQNSVGVRPGQTIMLKTISPQGPRQRLPTPGIAKPVLSGTTVRMQRVPSRHPAPLPESIKQYPSQNWKALPPAPELKLSKVDNGIVISWKIDGYQEDIYEEIASYQLYAYQETTSPPSTALWKKIGDVKALALPMACTLTQFMAGYKYYFAVRAVDVRSRLGPFSLPGSILLLNKL